MKITLNRFVFEKDFGAANPLKPIAKSQEVVKIILKMQIAMARYYLWQNNAILRGIQSVTTTHLMKIEIGMLYAPFSTCAKITGMYFIFDHRLIKLFKVPIAKIINVKNARAWVSMVSYA